MKKSVLVLLLAAVMMLFAVSCAEEAHEHTWDEGKVTTPATCTDPGVKTYKCACGETKTEAIPALGHDYSTEWTIDTPATCTDPGSKSHHCSRCTSKSDVTPIEALGHDYSTEWTIDTPATCTEPGSKSHHCSRCTSKSDVTPIEATGHTYSDEWSSDADNHWHAATCGHDVKSDIAAHTWGDWANTTPATVLAEGVDTKTCSVCGKTETRPVAKLALEVSTFEEFVAAFAIEREAGTPYTIKLTADIAWDQATYPGSTSNGLQTANALVVEADGLTIDLGTHSITGMVPQGLNIKGSNITIKNGSFLRDNTKFTDLTKNRYGLCVDYSTSNKAEDQKYEQNITLKDITTDAGVNLGYVKNVLIENFTVSSDTYRPLCLCGTQDVVIKNSSITKIVGGTTSDAALLVTQSGSATMDGTVSITNNVTGAAVYALSISGGSAATGASVTIADGASVTISTVSTTVKADPVYLTYGASLIVDGTLNLSTGANTNETYAKGTGVFFFTGKDSDSAGRSSVTVNGSLNITLPEGQSVIAFANNSPAYYVVKFAQGSTLTLNSDTISALTAANHCYPATNVNVITSEEDAHEKRLTFIDLR